MSIYLDLTASFNEGRLRAILSSGQAVVLHRLAVMSKDGDWIVREDDEATDHILHCLDRLGARYRFGAPFDKRWLAGGWSSHFEFTSGSMRVRTDFVSRPPRISAERLEQIWIEIELKDPPFVSLEDLAELKKTNREKDYAILGELARKMTGIENKIRYSRSAKEIIGYIRTDPDLVIRIMKERGISKESLGSVNLLEQALDEERRRLMHANEQRLTRYLENAKQWQALWKEVEREVQGRTLIDAHSLIVERAKTILPFSVSGDTTGDRA
jgi:hypothetical protein